MTATDPRSQPPIRSNFSLAAGLTISAAVAIGGLLQEVRWRGGFSGIVSSPIESPAQQLKLGEFAFKNGNDAVALSLFDRFSGPKQCRGPILARAYDGIGLGCSQGYPEGNRAL